MPLSNSSVSIVNATGLDATMYNFCLTKTTSGVIVFRTERSVPITFDKLHNPVILIERLCSRATIVRMMIVA